MFARCDVKCKKRNLINKKNQFYISVLLSALKKKKFYICILSAFRKVYYMIEILFFRSD